MNEMTLQLLPLTKVEQKKFAETVINEILDGNIDPLQVDIRLKAMSEVIKNIRENDDVKSCIINEADKFGKTFSMHGATITVSQKTVKDYVGIDPVLDSLYQQLEQTKAQIKAREMTVNSGCDPVTGETFSPPKTSTTRFLTYKF